MKIGNRIFMLNTSIVLLSLLTLLGVVGGMISTLESKYDAVYNSIRVEPNIFNIKSIIEDFQYNESSWKELGKELNPYNYQLYVEGNVGERFSNLRYGQTAIIEYVESTETITEEVGIFYWENTTAVSKIITTNGEQQVLWAINGNCNYSWFGASPNKFGDFLVTYIIVGITVILILLLISLLFTKRLVKRIMLPINKLIESAKRIEEGNLSTHIVYKGEDEFETLCTVFNQMQDHLIKEQSKNASYEKARTDMISGISHDLRTPLTSVKGYIKGILDGIANTPNKQIQYLSIAYKKACDMDVLLQQLFYYSKLETSNLPLYLVKVDFTTFITTFISDMQADLKQKNVKVFFEKSEGPHNIKMDTEQMNRVFINLLDNSMKYANTEDLVIKISVESREGMECIRFSDNGGGVDPIKLPYLFEQFYRCDEARSSSDSKGSGLGLYIVKHIVEAHGGTVEAKNNHGLTIIITLK
ncbi:Adaptive-response sensory-kinase SasA [Paenibacillus auburnensis]|uniref:histidine kinase n=1 Tax=Paenibacillus auburnensis TaxID=2905649 RepID=A0ABN8GKX5_9BACL|nr:HAMP domain-containing sensor histidine kinase [Paenibacillus auburnensis]CAH1208474.1 Adaptive-response sensory-kinase SasA [Paenibacillus auburnensis]